MEDVKAKTPVLQDKRLWVSVATILGLFASSVFGLHIDPEVLGGILFALAQFVVPSFLKEASIAKAKLAAPPTVEAPPPAPVLDVNEALRVIQGAIAKPGTTP